MADPAAPADRIARLRLIRSENIGPITYFQLLARFGSAQAAIDAIPDLAARGGGRPPRLVPRSQVEREIEEVERLGARYLFLGHPPYPQPDRIEVADQRAEGGERIELRLVREDPADEQDRGGALGRVEQQGERGEALAAGPEHVGRADIARADAPEVAGAGQPSQHDAERDRAEQIADEQRSERLHESVECQRPIPGKRN